MTNPFNTSDFKALNAQWSKRLKKAGFQDIEKPDGFLEDRNKRFRRLRWAPVQLYAEAEYYRLAESYLHRAKFKNKTERRIWELHAEGQTVREIARLVKRTRSYVHRRVEKHRLLALAPETERASSEAPDAADRDDSR